MRRTVQAWDAVTQAALPSTQVTHLHLLRHGAVDTGGERLAYGHSDLPLSGAGLRANAELEVFCREVLPPVDRILTSDLSRCRVLAEALGRALAVPVQLEPALREQHMGAWEGRSWASLTAEDEDAVQAYWADYLHARPPGGESLADLSARVDAWWAGVAPDLAGGRHLVVTHVGVVRVLLCRALGVPLDQALRFAPGRGTHTHLLASQAGWVVQALGEAPVVRQAPARPAGRRIALSGSAGTGKSTLGRALAERLGLPYIPEGMRRRLEGGLDLHSLDHDQFRALLWELWAEQVDAEDAALAAHGGFVADRSPYDYAAFWLHYRFPTLSTREETERFFAETRARGAALDRVLVLPWGALPLQADGVRNANPWLQRHYQACVEGLLAREAPDGQVLHLPGLTELEARLSWALERLAPARASTGS